MIQKAENLDLVIASVGNKTAYTGLGVSIFGWLTTIDAIGLTGVFLAALGFITNYYFKRRSDAREAAAEARKAAAAAAAAARDAADDCRKAREHELRMELMRQRGYILHGPVTEMGEQDA